MLCACSEYPIVLYSRRRQPQRSREGTSVGSLPLERSHTHEHEHGLDDSCWQIALASVQESVGEALSHAISVPSQSASKRLTAAASKLSSLP